MSSYETCRECDSETGRAGASEDSLYHSYVGPFCEDCYDDWPDKIEAELAKVRREFRDFRAGQAASVPDDRISVHEYTARISLQALEEYAENLSIVAGWDYEPLEHHYAQQAIEDIQDKLTEQEKGHE